MPTVRRASSSSVTTSTAASAISTGPAIGRLVMIQLALTVT